MIPLLHFEYLRRLHKRLNANITSYRQLKIVIKSILIISGLNHVDKMELNNDISPLLHQSNEDFRPSQKREIDYSIYV